MCEKCFVLAVLFGLFFDDKVALFPEPLGLAGRLTSSSIALAQRLPIAILLILLLARLLCGIFAALAAALAAALVAALVAALAAALLTLDAVASLIVGVGDALLLLVVRIALQVVHQPVERAAFRCTVRGHWTDGLL